MLEGLELLVAAMTAFPRLINGAQQIWQSLATLHNAGGITLTADQIAAMNAAGVTLDQDIAALQAAAGPRPIQ